MIKALIFDFDGIIIDSESPELLAWQEVFAAHGRELDLEVWADLVGRPRNHFDLYKYFQQQIDPAADIAASRADRPVALRRRWRRACSRQPMRLTAAGRSGFRRPVADCSG